jgi:hypothetical protein
MLRWVRRRKIALLKKEVASMEKMKLNHYSTLVSKEERPQKFIYQVGAGVVPGLCMRASLRRLLLGTTTSGCAAARRAVKQAAAPPAGVQEALALLQDHDGGSSLHAPTTNGVLLSSPLPPDYLYRVPH